MGKINLLRPFTQAWEFYTRKSFLLHPVLSPSCSLSLSRCGSTRRLPTSGCPSPCSSWPGSLPTSGRTTGRARPPTSGPSPMLSGLVSAPSFARAAISYRGYKDINQDIICLKSPSRTISTRTIAIMWWFFTLIMMSSYTANLAGNYFIVMKISGWQL